MNICFVSHQTEVADGIGVHYYRLSEALVRKGNNVHLVILPAYSDGINVKRFENGIHIYEYSPEYPNIFHQRIIGRILQFFKVFDWYYFIHRQKHNSIFIENIINKNNIDILESTNANGLTAYYSRKKTRIPMFVRVSTLGSDVAVYENSGKTKYERQLNKAEVEIINNADKLFTHTKSHRDLVCEKLKISAERFQIIPHGIKVTDEFCFSNNSELNILYVGTFSKRKGIDILLKAIPIVLKSHNCRFTLVGNDAENMHEKRFKNLHDNEICKKVEFCGFVSNQEVERHYKSCDILVAPSLYESFGQIYLEAMSHGKPVIGCNAGGIPEVITEGVTGLLAEPSNSTSLAEKIITLCKDCKLRNQMGKQGFLKAKTSFNIEKIADDTLKDYSNFLQNRYT